MTIEELGLPEEQLKSVQKLIQSESDKVRTEYSNKIKDLQSNSKSIDDYNELDNKYNSLTEELNSLREYKAQNEKTLRENKINNLLERKGLSKMAKYLNLDGVEDIETYINDMANELGSEQKSFIPNAQNDSAKGNITKEDFMKMNYTQRAELYNNNKELYDTLSR